MRQPANVIASPHGWELRRWRRFDCAWGAGWQSRRGRVAHARVALRLARNA